MVIAGTQPCLLQLELPDVQHIPADPHTLMGTRFRETLVGCYMGGAQQLPSRTRTRLAVAESHASRQLHRKRDGTAK